MMHTRRGTTKQALYQVSICDLSSYPAVLTAVGPSLKPPLAHPPCHTCYPPTAPEHCPTSTSWSGSTCWQMRDRAHQLYGRCGQISYRVQCLREHWVEMGTELHMSQQGSVTQAAKQVSNKPGLMQLSKPITQTINFFCASFSTLTWSVLEMQTYSLAEQQRTIRQINTFSITTNTL